MNKNNGGCFICGKKLVKCRHGTRTSYRCPNDKKLWHKARMRKWQQDSMKKYLNE